jgi:two-component system sensor histidine kinase KdpD
MRIRSRSTGIVFGIAVSGLVAAAATLLMLPLRGTVNATTVTLIYLLVVVVLSSVFESWVAIAASVMASLLLNFFFIEPYHTFTIDEPQNVVSLLVFLAVAITVGHLSATSNRRRAEAERLYSEMQEAFEKASETEGIKRSEKLKSALLDAVTHDFRTPLTSIKASVTMLIDENEFGSKETKLDRRGRGELLEVINEETDRLNTFVESMVELARFQSGSSELKLTRVTAEEIIVKAAKRANEIQRSHRLISNIAPDLPPMSLDSRFIVEAVFNLIDNAAKYSPPGTPIEITARRSNGGVRIAVEDEGPGVPEEEREAVFKKFYRSAASDDRDHGMGMGLAIVRGIIEAHGGEIWVETGRSGARFVFDLPVSDNGNEEKDPGRR